MRWLCVVLIFLFFLLPFFTSSSQISLNLHHHPNPPPQFHLNLLANSSISRSHHIKHPTKPNPGFTAKTQLTPHSYGGYSISLASVPHPRLSPSSSTLPAASSGLLAQPTTAARTASLSLLRPPQSLPFSPCSPPRRRSLDVETLNVPGSTADSTPTAPIAATGIAPAGITPRSARHTSSPTALAPS
ncbi:hypothetical protein LINPERHAP2_LOCUS3480 [Linum perenne]